MEFLKRTGWLVLDLALFFILFGGVTVLFFFGLHHVTGASALGTQSLSTDPYYELATSFLPQLLAALIAAYIAHVMVFKRPLRDLGIVRERSMSQFAVGYLLSFCFLVVGFLLLYAIGWIEIDQIDNNAYLFLGFALLFVVQSGFEEVVSRSYMIPAIASRFGKWPAVVLTSLIFAALHLANPNVSVLAILNIFAAGMAMGLLFIRYRSIWAPLGLHAGWNFLQGSFFGFEVSGHDVYSFLDTKETGPDIWTGGAFGFEGSIISLIILSSFSFLLIRTITKQDHVDIANSSDEHAVENEIY